MADTIALPIEKLSWIDGLLWGTAIRTPCSVRGSTSQGSNDQYLFLVRHSCYRASFDMPAILDWWYWVSPERRTIMKSVYQPCCDACIALTNFLPVSSSTTGVTVGKVHCPDQLIIHEVKASWFSDSTTIQPLPFGTSCHRPICVTPSGCSPELSAH